MALRTTQQVAGTCVLHAFEPHEQRAEVGCLLAQAYWGQGLMPEALHAVIDVGVRQLGLATLRADIDEPNGRSRAVFHRLGLRPIAESGTLFDFVVG